MKFMYVYEGEYLEKVMSKRIRPGFGRDLAFNTRRMFLKIYPRSTNDKYDR